MNARNPFVTAATPPTPDELSQISSILHEAAGIVIAPGKTSMVQSRLAKRLRALGLPDYASYIKLVRSPDGSAEMREMISALTTNVTHFFRENHHFDHLRTTALPPLLERARKGDKVRIWSAGCSIGAEAYSIAMVLSDMAQDLDRLDVRILATDIDPVVVRKGSEGLYDGTILDSLPTEMRRRFFAADPEGERIDERLRRLVSFKQLNLHGTWPMKGQFDIVFCRNVVIYFDAPTQRRLWDRFAQAIKPEGWLYVGHSERVPTEGSSPFVSSGITTYRLSPTGPRKGEQTWH